MEVNQSGIFAQREAFETVLLCSNRANLSRRNRPALPPEEERSSATNEPGRLNTVGTLMLVLLYALYAVDECTCWEEEEEEDIAKSRKSKTWISKDKVGSRYNLPSGILKDQLNLNSFAPLLGAFTWKKPS